MKFKRDIIKNIDMVLASLLLFSSLCLTSRTYIFVYIFIELLTALYIFHQKIKIRYNIFIFWYIIISFIICLYGLFTPYLGWFSFQYYLVICLSVIELYFLFNMSNKDLYKSIIICIVMTTYICAFYLLIRELPIFISKFIAITQGKDWFRLGVSSDVNPTAIAYFFGILSQFSIYHFARYRDKKIIFSILIQIIMIILSGSKKGMILLLIPLFIFAIDNSMKNPKNIIKYILTFIFMVFLIFNVPFLYNIIGYRIIDFFQAFGMNFIPNQSIYSQADTSTSLRVNMIMEAYDLFKRHIFFGNGWNAFAGLTQYRYYSHCNYLELLSSMGLFGFGLYYSIYYFIMRKIIHLKNIEHKLLIISLIAALLISDFSSITMYDTVISYFAILIVSLIVFVKYNSIQVFLKNVIRKDEKI